MFEFHFIISLAPLNAMRIYCQLTHNLKRHYRTATQKQDLKLFPIGLSLLSSQNPYSPFLQLKTKRRQFVNLLQSLTSSNPTLQCKQVHAQIVISGVESDTFIANILLNYYKKCGLLRYGRRLFDKMPEKNLISWSSVVTMYAQYGFGEDALLVFLEFKRSWDDGPNGHILASAARACAQLDGSGDIGEQVHCVIIKYGFDQDVFVGTSLVDLYAKSGVIDNARMVFDGLLAKSAVTWTSIIKGYIRSGRSKESLLFFKQMRETGILPDRYVLSSVLGACSKVEFVEGGKQVHGHVLRRATEMDVSAVNALIDFYFKCGIVKSARKLFDWMVDRDVISWTTMIAGYMQNSFDNEAVKMFSEMGRMGWKPDGFACTSILTSSGSLSALQLGRQVHAYIFKASLICDLFVTNGLIDMYAKCDSLADARRVFDAMVDHNVVSYNAMIEGYSRQEQLSEALILFHRMRLRLVPPSLLTFVSLLGLLAALSTLELSKQIHTLTIKFGVSLETFTGSALIDVYSKCSCIKDARLVFNEMKEKDIVVWNAMFSGYNQQSESEEAFKLYSDLLLSEQEPNDFTFSALITAASNIASLQNGQQLHTHVIKKGIEYDPVVINSLVDMYAKCGGFEDASKSFSSTVGRDVVCWNTMISTCAHHGKFKKALQLFEEMIKERIKPNYVTFVGVLSACSHAGLIEDGFHYLELMPRFGVIPGTEHYACVVSLLGRAGKLNEAKEFIMKMPIKPGAAIWRSLLSACRISGNVELGKYAAEMAISSDPRDSGSYTLLSNIFASKGMWLDVKLMRERLDVNGVVKEPGCSWIEVNNKIHMFLATQRTCSDNEHIYSFLDDLILHIKGTDFLSDFTTSDG